MSDNAEKKSCTECLAEHMERLCSMPLTSDVQENARMCLLDHLAAVFSAQGGKVCSIGAASVGMFGDGRCTLIGSRRTSSVAGATFYNALAATSEDLDDAHRYASGLHMSSVTFPVLFALSERDPATPVTGERFIRAMLCGYEISSRIVRAADAGIRSRGYHSTGPAGVFGACAAAGVILGLDREATVNALGIAASGSGGLFAFLHEGASVRHAHSAWASVNGLSAAAMAKSGLTGPRFALEGYNGKDGWFPAYAGTWDASFIERQTERPELLNGYHKLHATCGHATPAITGLQLLRGRVMARRDEIESILIKGYKASAALNNPNPQTVTQAKFSLPFITGLILCFGRATLREMTPENLNNAEVRRFAALTTVVEDPEIAADFPRLRAGEVLVKFKNGEQLCQHVDAPLGMPENPVDLSAIEAKFTDAAEGVLPDANISGILSAVHDLDALDSMAGLVSLLGIR